MPDKNTYPRFYQFQRGSIDRYVVFGPREHPWVWPIGEPWFPSSIYRTEQALIDDEEIHRVERPGVVHEGSGV